MFGLWRDRTPPLCWGTARSVATHLQHPQRDIGVLRLPYPRMSCCFCPVPGSWGTLASRAHAQSGASCASHAPAQLGKWWLRLMCLQGLEPVKPNSFEFRFQTTVSSTKKHSDFALPGQWDMVTKANGQQALHIFDAVGVCAGYVSQLTLPLDPSPDTQNLAPAKLLASTQQKRVGSPQRQIFCSLCAPAFVSLPAGIQETRT